MVVNLGFDLLFGAALMAEFKAVAAFIVATEFSPSKHS